MQNDLISRKVVMEYLQEQQTNVIIEKHKNGFVSQEVCDGMKSAIDAFINFIVRCPTAYDAEKVIEQISAKKLGGRIDAGVVAKEIIRNGGKE